MTETRYTDERLRNDMENGPPGPKNSAPYLLQVPAEDRDMVVGQAHRFMNMTPGWIYSASVAEIVRQYNRDPDAFKSRLQKQRERTTEVLAWERQHGAKASLISFEGQPGDHIGMSVY